MSIKITLGTRGSDLALWQANHVAGCLRKRGAEVEMRIISTGGDRIQHLGFDKMEGKGFFTKELEEALLSKHIDLAVHSCKDLETVQPEGLFIATYAEQADPRDVLLIRKDRFKFVQGWPLPENAQIGTSSARRKSQLLAHRSDLIIKDLRGNVPTRVNKLRENQYDAIVLAAAGLERLELELSDIEVWPLPALQFIPAAAQGVLALQTRSSDNEIIDFIRKIWPWQPDIPVHLERTLLNEFQGGCQVPLGIHEQQGNLSISYAPKRNLIPVRLTLPSPLFSSASFRNQVIDFCKIRQHAQKVFISRDSKCDILSNSLEAFGCQFTQKSLIYHTRTEGAFISPPTEWVFFCSSNAVKNTSESWLTGKKIAAIGEGTAQTLYDLGLSVDFIGSGGDTSNIALEFCMTKAPKSVLLPQSSSSLNKVYKVIQQHTHVEKADVYNTHLQQHAIEPHDIYVFTSPSNVEAFTSCNSLPPDAYTVAMGPSTMKALKNHSSCIEEALSPCAFGLTDAVFRSLFKKVTGFK